MTALDQYTRLEAAGIWREAPDRKRRDVIVSFGDATLILSDPRSEMPLTHWSLPAVTRLNGDRLPALYAPGTDTSSGEEILEVDDPLMVEAIARVHQAIAARRPHPGRLRFSLMLIALAGMAAAAALWLPDALIRYGACIAPEAARQQIGRAIVTDMQSQTGPACTRPGAQRALNELARHLIGPNASMTVLPAALPQASLLPGDIVVVGRNMIEDHPDAQVLAGYVLSALTLTPPPVPTQTALRHGGLRSALAVLAVGQINAETMRGHAQQLLSQPFRMPPEDPLLARFTRLGIASTPFAQAIDDSGETVLALIEADPLRDAPPNKLFSDKVWHTVQRICHDPARP
ncbi:hypothetical protein [Paracoccus jiaweipingae]|uniref:hypothetical protein n=1 Tax=unclassified Paracoccus (in: a-proteobacteria) TaxID=2688777 RepID=UPI0037BE12B2